MLINYGPDAGKIATVIDVVDSKRILIDGPKSQTDVKRQVIGIKRVSLTDIVVEGLGVGAKENKLDVQFEEQNILEKWEESSWSKKLQRKQTRANTGDFDRFRVMVAKKQKSKAVAAKLK